MKTKNYVAGAAVAARRIVKLSDDNTVIQAAAATDLSIGVSTEVAAASGARCDVHLNGVVEVEAGGNITRGNELTADADGKAVAAAPAQGVNNRVIGIALASAASGDVILMSISPSVKQGA